MGNKEDTMGSGYHYSKEFKNRFISEWNTKYRFLFTSVVPDRNNVKKVFLRPMANVMITEFSEEALKHGGKDIKKLIQNLYHCYVRWIEIPTRAKYEKYEIDQPNSATNLDSIITSVTDTTTGITIHSDNDKGIVPMTDSKLIPNETTHIEGKTKKYSVTLQYGKPFLCIVFKWNTVTFDVSAKDKVSALAKAYEKLWRTIDDISHIKVREKEVLVKA